MSCDYPCHICDPQAWEEESRPAPYDFYGKMERALLAFDRAQFGERHAPYIWWVPMDGWPEGVTVHFDRQVEELDFGGVYSRRAMIVDNSVFLEKDQQRVRVQTVMQAVDWKRKTAAYTEVQSRTCPPWGWWMPSLRNLW